MTRSPREVTSHSTLFSSTAVIEPMSFSFRSILCLLLCDGGAGTVQSTFLHCHLGALQAGGGEAACSQGCFLLVYSACQHHLSNGLLVCAHKNFPDQEFFNRDVPWSGAQQIGICQAIWQVLQNYTEQGRVNGSHTSNPPQKRGKCLTCFCTAGRWPVPRTSMPGV